MHVTNLRPLVYLLAVSCAVAACDDGSSPAGPPTSAGGSGGSPAGSGGTSSGSSGSPGSSGLGGLSGSSGQYGESGSSGQGTAGTASGAAGAGPGGSGSGAGGESAAAPAWLKGKPLNEWFDIPGTTLAGSVAAPGEDVKDPYCLSNRATRAYSGMAFNQQTAEMTVAASGGHQDSSDNSVRSLRLDADAPQWQLRMPPSPASAVVQDQPYYTDGKPASRHVYWSAQWVASRQRVMLLGTRFVYGNGVTFFSVNGFDLATGTWDAQKTWADTPGGVTACCDEAFCWATGEDIFRWEQATDTWTKTASFPTIVANPTAIDTRRKRFASVAWGNGQANGDGPALWLLAGDGASRQPLTFKPGAAWSQWQADRPAYAGMEYDEQDDLFFFYEGRDDAPGRVYKITPNDGTTWDMEILALGPGSVSPSPAGGGGVMSKFRYSARLRGLIAFTDSTRGVSFLRLAP